MNEHDTIFALSSAPGKAAVAVVRLSGPGAGAALTALAGTLPPARRAQVLDLCAPEKGEALDQALVLWFPGPASFTGEDMAELQLHGGRAVVAGVLATLGELPGLRPAEAGEFTRRAFDNGRLDLTEVEGLADLIAAETEGQRRQALRQMGGTLSRRAAAWRETLVTSLAHLEATIDFSEEDLPGGLDAALRADLADLAEEIEESLTDRRCGERLREGLEFVLLGAPNVGKSSLLNALARRDVAIVSETAGTTRDLIAVPLDLGGYPVTLVDTAGLRAAATDLGPQEAIEAEGMRRADVRGSAADLRLLVCDARDLAASTTELPDDPDRMVIANKVDLCPDLPRESTNGALVLFVSAKTGAGLDDLVTKLTEQAAVRLAASAGGVTITRDRHRRALADCAAALRRALTTLAAELAAEDLRLALRALGRLVGQVDVEDILDVIFADFCIGK